MRDPSFRKAQQYYAQLRQAAYAEVRGDALATGYVRVPLRLADCTARALAIWRETWTEPHPSGWGNWDWEALMRRAWKHPAWLNLAIWSGNLLCGLAVGRVSNRTRTGVRSTISIDFIESAHDLAHPLRGLIAPLVIDVASTYGRATGAEFLRLTEPLPGVVPLYERHGFTPVLQRARVLYCERRIEP